MVGTNDTVTGALPLSAAQRGLWFAQRMNPEAPMTVAQYLEFSGDLDVELLVRCARQAADEFESPLLRFAEVDHEPYQFLDNSDQRAVQVADLRSHPDPETSARELMARDCRAPIDLLRDDPQRSIVFVLNDSRYLWYSRIHHVALDGVGSVAMVHRVAELYTAHCTGAVAPPSSACDTAQILEYERAYRESRRYRTDREYWAAKVEGLDDTTSLADGTAAAAASTLTVGAQLTPAATRLLDAARERYGTGTAVPVIAALAVYLARITDRTEVVVTLPVSGRTTARMRRSGGMTANTVPLRIRAGPETTVGEIVSAVQLELTGALRHQRYPRAEMRRDDGADHAATGPLGPLVNIMLSPTR